MRLSELNARIEGNFELLYFVCPVDKTHSILVALNKPFLEKSIHGPEFDKFLHKGAFWKTSGDSIENISLTPSVDCTRNEDGTPSGCKFHGFVTDGEIE